jgi:hypothetical protein
MKTLYLVLLVVFCTPIVSRALPFAEELCGAWNAGCYLWASYDPGTNETNWWVTCTDG